MWSKVIFLDVSSTKNGKVDDVSRELDTTLPDLSVHVFGFAVAKNTGEISTMNHKGLSVITEERLVRC